MDENGMLLSAAVSRAGSTRQGVAAGLLARRVLDEKSLARNLNKRGFWLDGTLEDPDSGRLFTDRENERWRIKQETLDFHADMLREWKVSAKDHRDYEAAQKIADDHRHREQAVTDSYLSNRHQVTLRRIPVLQYILLLALAAGLWAWSAFMGGWPQLPYLWAAIPAALAFGAGSLVIRAQARRGQSGFLQGVIIGSLLGMWTSYGPIHVTALFSVTVLLLVVTDFRRGVALPFGVFNPGSVFGSVWRGYGFPDYVAGQAPRIPTGLPGNTRLGNRVSEIPETFTALSHLMHEPRNVAHNPRNLVVANLALDIWSAATNSSNAIFSGRFGLWSVSAVGRAYAFSLGDEIGRSTLLNSAARIAPLEPEWVTAYCQTIREQIPAEDWEWARCGLLDILCPREQETIPNAVAIRLNTILGVLLRD